MLKKHILSKYADIHIINKENKLKSYNISTGLTEQIEVSDPDEFTCIEGSVMTFDKEDSDPDEFNINL